MTTPRTDTTRVARAARKTALLDVAARRMGHDSWGAFGQQVRSALERAETTGDVAGNLNRILRDAAKNLDSYPENYFDPPADLLAALAAHPKKSRAMTMDEIVKREA